MGKKIPEMGSSARVDAADRNIILSALSFTSFHQVPLETRYFFYHILDTISRQDIRETFKLEKIWEVHALISHGWGDALSLRN